jgi:hypothetical protein
VTAGSGMLRPTDVCDETISDKLGIPRAYLRRLRTETLPVPDIYGTTPEAPLPLIDATVNALLVDFDKPVLVRGFKPDNLLDEGVCRAILSDGYRAIDHLDTLYSALEAVREIGADVTVRSVDLSERAMRVRFVAPAIEALAPILLRGYRSPFTRDGAPSGPVIWAGFELSNSETGGGAYRLVPRFEAPICTNGLTITKDVIRQVHIGGKLDEGVVAWSTETREKNLELVRSQTKDAVKMFLNVDYMTAKIAEIETKAGREVTKPEATIEVIAKTLKYSETERETLLSHFIGGGQPTAGGLLNAATSMAQTVADPDRAAEIEAGALAVLDLVH